jgi:P-type Cu+ transporter
MVAVKETPVKTTCYHCRQTCNEIFEFEEKQFCCYGCKTVYEILSANDLCEYYQLDQGAGVPMKEINLEDFAYLDEETIRRKLLSFDSESFARISFFCPAIHCISCVWLLENLQKFDKAIVHSEVNFSKKSVTVDFDPSKIALSRIAGIISSVGYTPQITLDSQKPKKGLNRSLVLRLAVAGFGFGNIMLFTFPEYLGIDHSEHRLMRIFGWLNLALATPVFFYSGIDYLTAAFKSFRQREINIDVPIAAGLIALYFRSAYDIITATGAGYLDSLTGLVFFLLIGRWFQSKTYESLAFDRDFKSYFPLAVNVLKGQEWTPVVIYHLKKGDTVRIRNLEIVPADATLASPHAYIDYSFVTGESRPVKAVAGDIIYVGGRLIGEPVHMIVEKATSQSHLTSLWNNSAFKKVATSAYQKIIDRAARRFTWIVLALALGTAIYWQVTNPSQMWLVLTSVLMVACPCALALAAPFTYGSMLRVFGKNNFYLKNADVIERLAVIDSLVFDKTGTVTYGSKPTITFEGKISQRQLGEVKLLTSSSTHPLSSAITKHIDVSIDKRISNFKEIPSKGIQGLIDGHLYKIGSPEFTGATKVTDGTGSKVFVSADGVVLGYFNILNAVRPQIKPLFTRLGSKIAALVSGDHDHEKTNMLKLFPANAELKFEQTPQDKLDYVRQLQEQGKKVMMIGDGLNDAGALKQADVGIAITDDTGIFTPGCDGILKGESLNNLDKFLTLSKASTKILKTAFAISFFYNAISLAFAMTGHLTPLVAAIIMPISSISVVGFSALAVSVSARNLKQDEDYNDPIAAPGARAPINVSPV